MVSPLETMIIRRAELDSLVTTAGVTSKLNSAASPLGGTFGMVRSGGHKAHTGWDLYAAVGTRCRAVCGCMFEFSGSISGYGNVLVVKLLDPDSLAVAKRYGVANLYALYGHISSTSAARASFMPGAPVALSGRSGNAGNTPPHLHFEVRKTPLPRLGDHATIDPAELLGSQYFVSRSDDEKLVKTMYGLK